MIELIRRVADKSETKKALVFLEKRINQLAVKYGGDPVEGEKEALFASWKCASCARNLGKYEGKLDKYKPWSVFPAKEIKAEKWAGYGQGFQNKVEDMVEKKGAEKAKFDDKGKMVAPYDLTREVNMVVSQKVKSPEVRPSTGKKYMAGSSSESSFMKHYGLSP